jgi:hypothetical protein
LLNKLIDNIEITSGTIHIRTFPSSILYILKKKPLKVDMSSNEVEIRSSDINYGLDRKYTADIYVLSYAGDEYLLAEKFFDEFDKLKIALNF